MAWRPSSKAARPGELTLEFERVLPADALGNISRGAHLAVESSACIVYSDAGLIATFGVSNLAVVQAAGKVLVCPKDRASDLKRLVSALGPDANR